MYTLLNKDHLVFRFQRDVRQNRVLYLIQHVYTMHTIHVHHTLVIRRGCGVGFSLLAKERSEKDQTRYYRVAHDFTQSPFQTVGLVIEANDREKRVPPGIE